MTQDAPAEPFGRLAPKDAVERISSGQLRVVDVREQWEYARDHIPNATLTPLGQIIARPEQVITADDVVFVCEVGQRSADEGTAAKEARWNQGLKARRLAPRIQAQHDQAQDADRNQEAARGAGVGVIRVQRKHQQPEARAEQRGADPVQ